MNRQLLKVLCISTFAAICLSACGGGDSTTLTEMTQPETRDKVVMSLSPSDRALYLDFLAGHSVAELDGHMTVREAINSAQKDCDVKKAIQKAGSQIK
ncbi:putative phosphoadenosine phosphosulfate sulfurtransferase [Silvimonas terrae]|uniref:Putative phosphoadenosine phosphosulfate sulfurtransferase n=1 Tax=Silvimonas terrae TaxID=300266 RepID=A0A840RE84_9NEIS|nr:hypothetical protein [Silvimonas terrae]MBB5191819.1 putative phosphoadenosine phosphosulfate sulfurtransferase [Silvimonas terrae]